MLDSELIYGLVQMPWWGYALVVYAGIQIMFLGITLFLHREQSHGGLDPASDRCGTCSASGCGSARPPSPGNGWPCIAATMRMPTSRATRTAPWCSA